MLGRSIEPIDHLRFESEVLPIIKAIFISESPFSPSPFNKGVEEKRILFDWNFKYTVDEPLISPLSEAAKRVGDNGFYLRGHLPQDDAAVAWYVPFSEIELYTQRQQSPLRSATSFEQTLVSPSGQWGIITSHETHMLLGSTKEFMRNLEELSPSIDNQVYQFIEHWQDVKTSGGSSTESWLPGLMEQVYGKEAAARMLDAAELP